MYSRILVPIDGSPTSQRGLTEALALAKRLDAAVVLLHVVDAYPMMIEMATSTTWDRISEGLRQMGRTTLEAAHAAAAKQGVPCESVLEDVAAARVADVIVEHEYDTKPMHQGYIEPHACVASADETGNIELWCCTQAPKCCW